MERIAIGSTNPAKIEAVRRAFDALAPDAYTLATVPTDGGTPQPWGEATTREGAIARASTAREAEQAAWGIGLEGGLVTDDVGLLVTSWIAAASADGAVGLARTAGFYLPADVADFVHAGHELADAWHHAHGTEEIGRGAGTIGYLTNGHIDRARLYGEAVIIAVTQARRP